MDLLTCGDVLERSGKGLGYIFEGFWGRMLGHVRDNFGGILGDIWMVKFRAYVQR